MTHYFLNITKQNHIEFIENDILHMTKLYSPTEVVSHLYLSFVDHLFLNI